MSAGDPLSPSCRSKLPRAKPWFLGLCPLLKSVGFNTQVWPGHGPGSCANARRCPGGSEGRGVHKDSPRTHRCARKAFLVHASDFSWFLGSAGPKLRQREPRGPARGRGRG